jgi:hypothetical protein
MHQNAQILSKMLKGCISLFILIEMNFFCRKLSRMFNTEACLNGSFLSLPDTHFRTSSNNPGIDLDQVIAVMEKLRLCDPKIQELVCFYSIIKNVDILHLYILYSYSNISNRFF